MTVKTYRVRNLFYTVRLKSGKVKQVPRFSYKVSYFAEGQRFQKLFADLAEAKAHAQKKAEDINQGNLKALPFGPQEVQIFTTASHYAKQAGVSLDLLAKEYAPMIPLLCGKMTSLEAIRDYVRQNPPEFPKMSLPEAVNETILARTKDGTETPI